MDFGDLMIFGMMIPNMIGLFLLSGIVRKDLNEYLTKLRSGVFDKAAAANESSADQA